MDDERRAGPHGCHGTAKSTGEPCKNYPEPGGRVCWLHGGKAPQARRKAAERVAEARARGELERILGDVPELANPLEALLQLAAQAIAWKELLARKVDDLASWTTETGALDARIVLFERALRQAGDFCAMLARLRIDERVTAIEVTAAKQVAGEFSWYLAEILRDLGLSPAQQARVPDVVSRALQAEPPELAGSDWHWEPDRPPPQPYTEAGTVTIVGYEPLDDI
jgi:hypothetical protein